MAVRGNILENIRTSMNMKQLNIFRNWVCPRSNFALHLPLTAAFCGMPSTSSQIIQAGLLVKFEGESFLFKVVICFLSWPLLKLP